jgi:hypothetical protein
MASDARPKRAIRGRRLILGTGRTINRVCGTSAKVIAGQLVFETSILPKPVNIEGVSGVEYRFYFRLYSRPYKPD